MLRRLVFWRLNGFEKQLGESLDYLRHMARISLRAFFRFVKLLKAADYRKTLPLDAMHVARIVGTRTEDCGPCVQIGINLAAQEGVSDEILQAVIDQRPDDLPEPLADVYRFTEAVLAKDDARADTLLERIRGHYGESGLVELALVIATCRIPATTKRVLGYAQSCSLVELRLAKSA